MGVRVRPGRPDADPGACSSPRPPRPPAAADAPWCCGYAAVATTPPRCSTFSVAERGAELFAYTLRGTDVERSGTVPEGLDPERVLSGADDGERERRLLVAVQDA
ncbi:hypothetical protein SALBM217S_08823 [Streptomyces griseoloalbus]